MQFNHCPKVATRREGNQWACEKHKHLLKLSGGGYTLRGPSAIQDENKSPMMYYRKLKRQRNKR